MLTRLNYISLFEISFLSALIRAGKDFSLYLSLYKYITI